MNQMHHAKFWMVWSPQGGAPTRKHASRAEADAEAERLAEKTPLRQFFVLKAVGGFVAEIPTTRPIELTSVDPGVPF